MSTPWCRAWAYLTENYSTFNRSCANHHTHTVIGAAIWNVTFARIRISNLHMIGESSAQYIHTPHCSISPSCPLYIGLITGPSLASGSHEPKQSRLLVKYFNGTSSPP
eukprot:scpid108671/ scgid21242/ 